MIKAWLNWYRYVCLVLCYEFRQILLRNLAFKRVPYCIIYASFSPPHEWFEVKPLFTTLPLLLLPAYVIRDMRRPTLVARLYPALRPLKHLVLDANLWHYYRRVDNSHIELIHWGIEKREPEVIKALVSFDDLLSEDLDRLPRQGLLGKLRSIKETGIGKDSRIKSPGGGERAWLWIQRRLSCRVLHWSFRFKVEIYLLRRINIRVELLIYYIIAWPFWPEDAITCYQSWGDYHNFEKYIFMRVVNIKVRIKAAHIQ